MIVMVGGAEGFNKSWFSHSGYVDDDVVWSWMGDGGDGGDGGGDGGGDDGVYSVDPGLRSSHRDIEMHSLLADTEWVGGLDPTPVLG